MKRTGRTGQVSASTAFGNQSIASEVVARLRKVLRRMNFVPESCAYLEAF